MISSRKIELCFLGKKPRNTFYGCVTIICLIISSGCTSSVALSQKDRASIQSVTISKDVSLPDKMYFETASTRATAGCCWFIGDAAVAPENQRNATLIQDAMHRSHIDLQQIVMTEFEKQLKTSNLFGNILIGGDNYPKLKLSITTYGFAPPPGFSDQLYPFSWTKGELVNADNSILWEKTVVYHAPDTHTLGEYLKDPELIRKGYVVISESAVSALIKDMKGD